MISLGAFQGNGLRTGQQAEDVTILWLATARSQPGATNTKLGRPTYSARPAPLPEPSGNLSSNLSYRVTREVLHRDAKTGLWSSTSEVAYYVANSAVSACLAATAIRHHWNVDNMINPASVVTRVSSHGCAASPTMHYAVTEPAPPVRTHTPPLSLDSIPWPTGASVESIEQPCGGT
jgi:hypothetical protein